MNLSLKLLEAKYPFITHAFSSAVFFWVADRGGPTGKPNARPRIEKGAGYLPPVGGASFLRESLGIQSAAALSAVNWTRRGLFASGGRPYRIYCTRPPAPAEKKSPGGLGGTPQRHAAFIGTSNTCSWTVLINSKPFYLFGNSSLPFLSMCCL